MKITIRIDEHLLKEAKLLALRQGKSLSSIIEDALRECLSRQRASAQGEPVNLITVSGQGLLLGVDLDDSTALLDVMGSPDD